jgi:WXXGXW repeat (2 copies)
MRRVLMIAGAAVICAGPALAADVTTETTDTTTVTKELVPAESRSGSTVATVIVAPEAPPPPRVEVRPEPPRPGMSWMEGHWEWKPDRRTYGWIPGEFAEPPQPRAMWSPGHWQQRPDGWVWTPGHWGS